MKCKRQCKTHIILVTYKFNTGVIERLKSISKAAQNYILTVLDNSPDKYKDRFKLRITLKIIDPTIIYIDHKINCRFHAYNIGLKTSQSEFTVFRTDDDIFDERRTAKLIDKGFQEDFIVTPYLHDDEYQAGDGYRRPLESLIIKTACLKSVLPFQASPNKDCELLRRLFAYKSCKNVPYILMHKKSHKREDPYYRS